MKKDQPYLNVGREAMERLARQIATLTGVVTDCAGVRAAPEGDRK